MVLDPGRYGSIDGLLMERLGKPIDQDRPSQFVNQMSSEISLNKDFRVQFLRKSGGTFND